MGTTTLKAKQHATLEMHGKTYELPLVEGSEGELALDISEFRALSQAVTIDPAYMNTAACVSEITFLDGENGILRYRGYPIEALADQSTFTEVAYLLVYGELPKAAELTRFEEDIKKHSAMPPALKTFLSGFPTQLHPMAALSSQTVALSGFFPEFNAPSLSLEKRREFVCHMMAQAKNLAAYFYRHTQGKDFVPSHPSLDYSSDFLHMMFGSAGTHVNKDVARALDVLLILHADHEQNCSTSTVRLVGSAQANPYATVSAGMDALWGPLHGGANQAVIEMLEAIQKDGGGYEKFVHLAKDKTSHFKLMGFGHRVYKNFDPRAQIIKAACDQVLSTLGVKDPLLDIARGLESAALQEAYFKDRKLYPNVDFYSGIIYKALGIPTEMFTVMFALGRMPGWLAQWNEMLSAGAGLKIGRPRQIYTGPTQRALGQRALGTRT